MPNKKSCLHRYGGTLSIKKGPIGYNLYYYYFTALTFPYFVLFYCAKSQHNLS